MIHNQLYNSYKTKKFYLHLLEMKSGPIPSPKPDLEEKLLKKLLVIISIALTLS